MLRPHVQTCCTKGLKKNTKSSWDWQINIISYIAHGQESFVEEENNTQESEQNAESRKPNSNLCPHPNCQLHEPNPSTYCLEHHLVDDPD